MHMYSSNKLIKFLSSVKEVTEINNEINSLFIWHGNYIDLGAHNLFVLMNDLTKFTVLIYGLNENHLNDIDEYIRRSIAEIMIANDIDKEYVFRYIAGIENINIGKSRDRASIATLNGHMTNVYMYLNTEFEDDEMLQLNCSVLVNNYITKDMYNKKEFIIPSEEMKKHLELLYENKDDYIEN